MAEEKYLGIPDIPVDTTSDAVTKPYDLNPDAKYTQPKYLTGEETRRRNLIDGTWKIETGAIQGDTPKVFEAITTLERTIGDMLFGRVPAKLVNEAIESPTETAAGAVSGTVGYTVGNRATSAFLKQLLGKYGTSLIGTGASGAAGVVGGIATGAGLTGLVSAFMPSEAQAPTPSDIYGWKDYDTDESRKAKTVLYTAQKDLNDKKITQEEYDKIFAEQQPIITKAQQGWRKEAPARAQSELQNAQDVLNKAKQDFAEGKITKKELDNRQKFFDSVVKQYSQYAKDLEGFNNAIDLLNGAQYPDDTFTDVIIANTAEFVQNKDFLEAVKNAQQGIDPEHWVNKSAQISGNMAPIIASTAFASKWGRLGRKQFLQSLINDTDFKTLKFKPARSRKAAGEIAEKVGMAGTFLQELADYTWEDKQKYIDETGDTTLSNYKGGGLSGAAHAAISAQIEFSGGIEPIFTGALRRVLKSSGGKWGAVKAIGKQALTTGGGESFEETTQGISRFLAQKISGTSDKTWGEAMKEWLTDAAWGWGFGTLFGGFVGAHNRAQITKALTEYGLKPDTAAKVADIMIDQVETLSDPRVESVRDNVRQKVALMYENADMSPAELEDSIDATTDLEMAMIARDAAERGIDIADHPLLDSTVNEIGWFRGGIPEQVADQVAALNDEIAGLREQLRQENAKEQKDFNKIEDLEAKIEQFYAKLPKEISDLVETDRQKVRQMLAAQSAELQTRQARRKLVRQVQQRAMNALQRAEESDVKQALRRLEQETKTEEKKAKEAERKQRTEQRKLRKAIEKVRQNIAKRKGGLPVAESLFEDADLVYKALKDSGFTDQQIAQMAEEDIVKTVAPYNISPITAEEQKRAVEQAADVADGTITTGTPEPVAENVIQDYGEKIEGAKKDLVGKGVSAETLTYIDKIMKKAPKSETSKQILRNWLEQQDPAFVAQIRQLNLPIRVYKTLEYRRVLEEAFTQHPELNQEADRYSVLAGNEELSKETLDKYGIIPEYDFYYKTTDDHYVKLTPENVSARIEGRGALQFSYSKSTRGTYFLWAKKGSGSWVPLIEFDSMEEMDEHRNSHTQEDREKIYQEMTSFKDNRKEKVIRERVGKDYRNGKNVTEEQFAKQFGFRGVQFGNYENQEKRQREINNSYDSFMDLAKILNLPPKAISLGGTLGIAFGARGSGSALAHYEPDLKVINITRDAGAGALAHEWFHALDNYLAQNLSQYANMAGGGFLTKADNYYYYRVNEELADSMKEYLKAIKGERNFQLRLRQLGQYWKRDWEVAARLFEQYVSAKVAEQNGINDYLASPQKYYISSSPYLKLDEAERVFPKLENMLKSIKTREEDGNVVLYQEQVDLADENARLDDIYPAYDGETIEVDGKERTVYNSNGDRIAKSAEALTNFWRWFGDSKVVDSQGRPLVVYHGTSSKFDTFKIGEHGGTYGTGIYFGRKSTAERYGIYTMPVYLKVENPFVVERNNYRELAPKANEAYKEYIRTAPETDEDWLIYDDDIINWYLKQQGFDGIIDSKYIGKGANEFVAFEPTQIKSVDNRGTFSSETPNIYWQSDVDNQTIIDIEDVMSDYNVPEVIDLVLNQDNIWGTLIDPVKYKSALEDFVKNGKLLRTKTEDIEKWFEIIVRNTQILSVITDMAGHGYNTPTYEIVDYFFNGDKSAFEKYKKELQARDEELPPEYATGDMESTGSEELSDDATAWKLLEDKGFFDKARLPDGSPAWSDFGLQPLWNIISQYKEGMPAEQVLVLINKALDVYHQNGDLASGFIKGGAEVATAISNDFPLLYQKQTVNQSKKRGFYSPELRLVSLLQAADPSSLSHELAHDWMQQFFRWYRSGKASESFMQSWGALEKALGISPDDINVPEKASEAFARAYEAWVMTKTDWEKGIDIDDENRDKIIELFKRYQGYLTDIYEDINNPYFIETWGETGKLKPELQAWFDNMTLQTDLIAARVATGAITPQQAQAEITARNVNQVVTAAEDNFTEKEKEEIAAVERMNDTSRYEVKGGNKNSLQNRLSGLARDIDDNNIALGRYDTHRDMLEVAKAADEFVRTRRDEALAIVNGLQPETEGLYASDLYTALERVARETNDVDLAMELVNSKVAKDLAKEWGQRVAGFRNFTGDGDFDVVSQLKSLDNKFKKDYDEKGKERVKKATDEFVEELEKADSEQDVDSFLDSVKCQ